MVWPQHLGTSSSITFTNTSLPQFLYNQIEISVYEYDIIYQKVGVNYGYKCKKYHCQCLT